MSITLVNLTIGQDYNLTGWHNASGGNFGFLTNAAGTGITITQSISSGATLLSSDTSLGSNINDANQGTTIETLDTSGISFTATGRTVEIDMNSNGDASFSLLGLSGLQVETVDSIPEPSSSLLLIGSLAGFCLFRKR